MFLPSKQEIDSSTPIYPASHFTWAEATKDFTRPIQNLVIGNSLIADSLTIETNIIKLAQHLDWIREQLGNRPIHVNSWYRPKHINDREGGAKYSQHLYGTAVDIRSDYKSAHQIYQILDKVWDGGLGRYFSFVHVDLGRKRRWIES